MKTYYRRRILTLTIAGGLLLAGCGLDSTTSETLAQHPRSDLLCLAEIPAAEFVFRPGRETEPEPSPPPTPIPSDDWARQWPKASILSWATTPVKDPPERMEIIS